MAFDSNTGMPLGVMDASYITSMRTGAAAAVGASALARKDSETLLLVGTGRQSIFLLGATLLELPQLKRVIVSGNADGRHLAEAVGAEEMHILKLPAHFIKLGLADGRSRQDAGAKRADALLVEFLIVHEG